MFSAPSDVTYPTTLGYFRQDGFDPDPYPVDMRAHQLDEDLIREINSAEGYQLRGELIDFQKENGHAQVGQRQSLSQSVFSPSVTLTSSKSTFT